MQDGLSTVTTTALIRFLNPYDSSFDVIEIGVDLKIGIKIELLYDFTLSGKVETLSMTANSLQTFFKTSVKIGDLAKKV